MARTGLHTAPVPGSPPVGTSPTDGRLVLGAQFGTAGRCLSGGTFTPSASTMQFAGVASVYVVPDSSNTGAAYHCPIDAKTLTPAAGPASGSRIDSLYVLQNDYEKGAADSRVDVFLAAGTAAASPTAPTIPTGAIRIANITVPTNATTATACTLTYLIAPATIAFGGAVTNSKPLLDLVPGTYTGQRSFTGGIDYRWNGSTWRPWDSDWVAFTGIGYDSGTGGNAGASATLSGQYRYRGGRVIAELFFAYGASGATPGAYWKFALPVPADASNWNNQATSCDVVFMNASEGFRRYVGGAYVETAGLLHLFAIGTNGTSLEVTGSTPFGEVWSNQDQIRVTVEYDPA